VNADPDDAQAMFELQLELHARVTGTRPPITGDELLEIHVLLEKPTSDLKSLVELGS
jgi:hypothetical protein